MQMFSLSFRIASEHEHVWRFEDLRLSEIVERRSTPHTFDAHPARE
jgi:hypothetical protein